MKSSTQPHSFSLAARGWTTFLTFKHSLLSLGLVIGFPAFGQIVTTTTNFTVGGSVPDASVSGLASAQIVSTPIASVTGVRVALKLTGAFNGDLFCYLTHSSGHVVLLNRVGRRAGSGLGYGDEGFDLTFDDSAANGDVHNYRFTLNGSHLASIAGALTNVWAPDARTNSPLNVLDTDPRGAFLSSFNGVNPNGEWVLFVADLEAGDIYTLDSWGLEITGFTSPSIVTHPVDQSAECSSGTANFAVTAQGSAPLSYHWRLGGTAIPGATSSTLTISNATFANAGQYNVLVTNSYGSVTSAVATLSVVDTILPVVTMLGANPMTNECHSAFTDPGATASDTCAGSLSVVTNNTVNPNAVSSYTITYQATDLSGNTSTATRTVYVVDTTPPAIACSTNITVITTNGSGATVTFSTTANDLCSGPATVICSPTSGSLFPLGTTTVNCTATDPSGNATNCSFTVTVTLNHAPVATNSTLGALANHPRSVLIEKLLTKASDADDDTLTLSGVSATSTNGGSVSLTGSAVIYTPLAAFVGTDLFTYTVSDGRGGIATASVLVQVYSESDPASNRIGTVTVTAQGVKVRFAGIPGYTYNMQRSSNLTTWTTIGAFTVPDNGLAEFIDATPPAGPNFYRTVAP